jgi:prepilin-type N-terminal cleavage/methylation domain-containing protein
MKKYLPNKNESSVGFTLIELMVVIAIIAILALVGLSVFSNAQKSARDAKRQADIDSIAKSIETSRDFSAQVAQYTYTATHISNDFPSIPTEPTSGMNYCLSYQAAPGAMTTPAAWRGTGACPAAGTWVAFSATSTIAAQGAFEICANLEANSAVVYCKKSLLR